MRMLALIVCLLPLSAAHAASDPAETVPFDHWAYDAVSEMLTQTHWGKPDFGHRAWSRYEWAIILARLVRLTEMVDQPTPRAPFPNERPNALAASLLREFWAEIEGLFEADEVLAAEEGPKTIEIREWLTAIPKGNWFHDAAQEILAEGEREPAGQRSLSFPDVPRDHWAYDAVEKLRKAGIMIGYPDGTFQSAAEPDGR